MCRTTAWEHHDVKETPDGRFRCEICALTVAKKAKFAGTDCTKNPKVYRMALRKAETNSAVT